MIACVVSSNAPTVQHTSRRSEQSSVNMLKRKRSYDSLFDSAIGRKRICRCADELISSDQIEYDNQKERKRTQADFSFNRALLDSDNHSSDENTEDEKSGLLRLCAQQQPMCHSNLTIPRRDRIKPAKEIFSHFMKRFQEEVEHIDLKRQLKDTKDQKKFYTYTQLCRICQKLLKEQESQLHEHYGRCLSNRLADQYDSFLRFSQEQLNDRFQHASPPSYIS